MLFVFPRTHFNQALRRCAFRSGRKITGITSWLSAARSSEASRRNKVITIIDLISYYADRPTATAHKTAHHAYPLLASVRVNARREGRLANNPFRYSPATGVHSADYYAITPLPSFRPRVSARKIVNEHSSHQFASYRVPPAFYALIYS